MRPTYFPVQRIFEDLLMLFLRLLELFFNFLRSNSVQLLKSVPK